MTACFVHEVIAHGNAALIPQKGSARTDLSYIRAPMTGYSPDIKGLHHNVYRCRDSEETRRFYEGLLGLRLASAVELSATKTGRPIKALHTFFEMGDRSFLAFFEVIGDDCEGMFEPKSDFDLHIALEMPDVLTLMTYKEKAVAAGVEVRGPSDHGTIQSIYLRDPNGYVIELTTQVERDEKSIERRLLEAHGILDRWQRTKYESPTPGALN
jgi:catechol 2,3-dioxygenase-like lactoylglutathione lyase family enzyme